ncbi:hypothetical protein AKJ61_01725 [candidate division MSBL1 archaeon SCGC-AAA259B11]|uniref:Uncharacterized protein n=1 Tax=candidate division MSBL1 archaeon SCGC-AAA259B11 TaxID=1698260 RepID=A0A133U709_9EURY|nr:hypothetical protein AKJ61_01725 [candidate division MSBL1 archaeon SCGC-AAA259B11]
MWIGKGPRLQGPRLPYANQEFKCAHPGCENDPRGGVFFRIVPQPEEPESAETIVALCEEHEDTLHEGVIDLDGTNITSELGVK